MSCEQHRTELKNISQNDASGDVRAEARKIHTDLSGACGIANSYRTHTSILAAGLSIEGANKIKEVWAKKKQEAVEFLERQNPIPPSQ